MLDKIFIIILLLSIAVAQDVQDVNESLCNNVFFFLVENNGDYLYTDLLKLSKNLNVDVSTLQNYSSHYEEICPKSLPFVRIEIKEEDFIKEEICDLSLKKDFLLINLDSSIPIPKWFESNMSCESINKYKWYFVFESSEDKYIVKGIRFYLFFFFIIIITIFWIAINSIRVNRLLKSNNTSR